MLVPDEIQSMSALVTVLISGVGHDRVTHTCAMTLCRRYSHMAYTNPSSLGVPCDYTHLILIVCEGELATLEYPIYVAIMATLTHACIIHATSAPALRRHTRQCNKLAQTAVISTEQRGFPSPVSTHKDRGNTSLPITAIDPISDGTLHVTHLWLLVPPVISWQRLPS